MGVRRALLGGLAYLVAIAVAFASPFASFAIDAAIAAYFALSRSGVPGLLIGSDTVVELSAPAPAPPGGEVEPVPEW